MRPAPAMNQTPQKTSPLDWAKNGTNIFFVEDHPRTFQKVRFGAKTRNIEKILNIDDVIRSDRAFLW